MYRVWMEIHEGKRTPEELEIEGKVVHMITGLMEVEHDGMDWV
jgi:hypothetical protein